MVDVIRRVTIQGKSEGLDKVASDLRGVAAAQKEVATVTDMSSRKTLSAAQAYDRLQRSLDPLYQSQQRVMSAERTLNRAFDEGLITLSRKNELLAIATRRHNEAAAAVTREAAAQAQANSARGRVGGLAASFAGGLAGGIAFGVITTLPSKISEVVSGLDDLGDAAERAGVSGQTLQVFRYELEQGAGSAEDADTALEKFRKTVGQLALTGKGPASEAMRALGISIRDVNGAVKIQDDLFKEVLLRLPLMRDQASQAAVSMLLFGKNSGSTAVALRGGAGAFQEAEDHLRSLNGLMTNEALAAADKFDKRFQDMSIQFEGAWRRITLAALEGLAKLGEVEHGLTGAFGAAFSGTFFESQRAQRAAERLALPAPKGDLIAGPAIPGITLPDLAAEKALSEAKKRATQDLRELLRARTADRQESARSATAAENDAQRQQRAIDDLNKSLDLEHDILGKSNADRRVETALRQLNISATSAEGHAIEQKIRRNEAEAEAFDKLRERMEFERDLTRGIFDDLRSGLKEGQGLWEAFGNTATNALDKVTNKMLDDLLDAIFKVNSAASGGGLSGILGSLFGGGLSSSASSAVASQPWLNAYGNAFSGGYVIPFAAGGVVDRPTLFPMARGIGLMGEAGPEAVMPLRRGADGRLGVSGGGVHVTINNNAGVSVQTEDNGVDANGVRQLSIAVDAMVGESIKKRSRAPMLRR